MHVCLTRYNKVVVLCPLFALVAQANTFQHFIRIDIRIQYIHKMCDIFMFKHKHIDSHTRTSTTHRHYINNIIHTHECLLQRLGCVALFAFILWNTAVAATYWFLILLLLLVIIIIPIVPMFFGCYKFDFS